ncbi:MAG: hypothetical protein Q9160_006021 [Pyrenula sp. 1 TL-2023]
MKILTKEEEQAHYKSVPATLKGGTLGGLAGLSVGFAGVAIAQRRYTAFRALTLPLKAFLVTSSGTFAGIISADHYSRRYEASVNVQDQIFQQRQAEERKRATEGLSFTERSMKWFMEEKYKIVGASWAASMVAAFALVGRNPYLTGQQKLVQARVYVLRHRNSPHSSLVIGTVSKAMVLIKIVFRYAQGLTLAVLVATTALEISEQNREKALAKEDPEHHEQPHHDEGDETWKSMVAAEEERFKERDEYIARREAEDRKKQHKGKKGGSKKHVNEEKPPEDDDEMPEKFIQGKRGEGKMMRKVTDKPGGAEGGVP